LLAGPVDGRSVGVAAAGGERRGQSKALPLLTQVGAEIGEAVFGGEATT